MEDLVGDFGGAPEIPGDDGAIGGVPARSICAAQKLRAFPEEEDVQGLLDGRLVASHHLQEGAPVRLLGPGALGRPPQGVRGQGLREGPVGQGALPSSRSCGVGGCCRETRGPRMPPGKCLSAQDLPTPPTALPDSTSSWRVPLPHSPHPHWCGGPGRCDDPRSDWSPRERQAEGRACAQPRAPKGRQGCPSTWSHSCF